MMQHSEEKEMATGEAGELRLCAEADVPEDLPYRVELPGFEPFCIYKVDGQVYVTDDMCTHGRASLGEEGELDGFTVICAWHDGSFDIRTGEVVDRPCTIPLKVYPAVVRNGIIFIEHPIGDE